MMKNTCPVEKQRFNRKGGLVGLAAGVVTSLCCLTPIVLIFFGLGTVAFAFSFVGLKPYFLLASIVFLLFSFFLYFRKRKCGLKTMLKSPFVITALIVQIGLFIGIFYGLLPLVSPYVFEKRLSLSSNVPEHPPSCHFQAKVSSKSLNALSCASCEAALKYELEHSQGVYAAEIGLADSMALVHYDKEKISSEDIVKILSVDFKVDDIVKQCL